MTNERPGAALKVAVLLDLCKRLARGLSGCCSPALGSAEQRKFRYIGYWAAQPAQAPQARTNPTYLHSHYTENRTVRQDISKHEVDLQKICMF